jgi:hypothetical protein
VQEETGFVEQRQGRAAERLHHQQFMETGNHGNCSKSLNLLQQDITVSLLVSYISPTQRPA